MASEGPRALLRDMLEQWDKFGHINTATVASARALLSDGVGGTDAS
jgi:hypothetical protein